MVVLKRMPKRMPRLL